MLHDGHELDMREAHVERIVAELLGKFAIGEPAIMFLRDATPGAQVHLIDRPRRVQRVRLRAPLEPLAIAPRIAEIANHRGGARRLLAAERKRITLINAITVVPREDLILVARPGTHAADESRPDAGRISAHAQGVRLAIPAVEIPDHGDRARVRRPYRKVRPFGGEVRAELFVGAKVAPFLEEIDVLLGQHLEPSSNFHTRQVPLFQNGSLMSRCQPDKSPANRYPIPIRGSARLRIFHGGSAPIKIPGSICSRLGRVPVTGGRGASGK